MDLHDFIKETRKINEAEWVEGAGTTDEPEVGPAPEMGQAPEVNDELVNSLSAEIPGLKDVDQEELKKGLGIEMEHFDTLGGDVNVVAKLTLDHLNEFPGQKYYTALEQLESELSQAGEQEVAPAPEAEPVAEEPAEPEVAVEKPVEEPVTFESKTEDKKEEKKEDKKD